MIFHQELLIDGTFIGGPCDSSVSKDVIKSPYDGKIVGVSAEADENHIRSAFESAKAAGPSWAQTPLEERAAFLEKIAVALRDKRELFAELMAKEIGKPITMGRAEVDRAVLTFIMTAGASRELLPRKIDLKPDPREPEFEVVAYRKPRGVMLLITPYNWPINLAAHKLAPALLCGCTCVLKGSPMASLTTLAFARLIQELGLPNGVLNAIHVPEHLAHKVSESPIIDGISFTGSQEVGWKIKEANPQKHVTLELGGNSVVVVTKTADLELAANQIAYSAFAYAGQVCISAQNIFVQNDVFERFTELFNVAKQQINCGDPMNEKVVCGPLISGQAKIKYQDFLEAAEQEAGSITSPVANNQTEFGLSVIFAKDWGMQAMRQEAFGPVVFCKDYENLDDVANWIEKGDLGLHIAIYSGTPHEDIRAFENLKMGGIVLNAPPSTRFDSMPYGGEKLSGFGREGAGFAFENYTYWQSVVINKQAEI